VTTSTLKDARNGDQVNRGGEQARSGEVMYAGKKRWKRTLGSNMDVQKGVERSKQASVERRVHKGGCIEAGVQRQKDITDASAKKLRRYI
jgi:hypothetical protein